MIAIQIRHAAFVLAALMVGVSFGAKAPTTGPADLDDIHTPRRMLAAAEIELASAQKQLEGVADKLRPAFEQSQEWIDAQAALKAVQAQRAAAVAAVMATLKDRADYTAAMQARDQAIAE